MNIFIVCSLHKPTNDAPSIASDFYGLNNKNEMNGRLTSFHLLNEIGERYFEGKNRFEQPNRLQCYITFYMGFCVGNNTFSHGIKNMVTRLNIGIEVFCLIVSLVLFDCSKPQMYVILTYAIRAPQIVFATFFNVV